MEILALLESSWLRILATLAAAGFGALWGSFFNVCIARVPRGMSVVRPPSHCFSCGHRVLARDNIPVLSYLLLRGRCRHCGQRFSPRYALVEAVTALLSGLVFWCFVVDAAGVPPGVRLARFAAYFAFIGVLMVLSFIDLDTKRLPDAITLPSVVVFFLAGFAVHEAPWLERAIGAAAGYLAVRIIADAYYYATGREGLGLGDGKLLAVIGALLGWKSLPPVIFLASLVGILVSVPVLVLRGRSVAMEAGPDALADPMGSPLESSAPPKEAQPATGRSIRKTEVPFGPFLAASALAYLFLERPVWAWISHALLGY